MKKVNTTKLVCAIVYSFIIATIVIGVFAASYMLGSYISYSYYSSNYNMTTGCPLADLNCTFNNVITCIDPFYKNCSDGGIIATIFIGTVINVFIILSGFFCFCCCWDINKNKKKNSNNEVELPSTIINNELSNTIVSNSKIINDELSNVVVSNSSVNLEVSSSSFVDLESNKVVKKVADDSVGMTSNS